MVSVTTRLSELSFSRREQKALELASVRTVQEFVSLDLHRVLLLRGCGSKTYQSLRCRQAEIRQAVLDKKDDAETVVPFWWIAAEEGVITARVEHALQRLTIRTLPEFLALDIDKLPEIRGCGPVTKRLLRRAQAVYRKRLEQRPAARLAPLNFSPSPDLPSASSRANDSSRSSLQVDSLNLTRTISPAASGVSRQDLVFEVCVGCQWQGSSRAANAAATRQAESPRQPLQRQSSFDRVPMTSGTSIEPTAESTPV